MKTSTGMKLPTIIYVQDKKIQRNTLFSAHELYGKVIHFTDIEISEKQRKKEIRYTLNKTKYTTASIQYVNASYCPFLNGHNICINKDYDWYLYLEKEYIKLDYPFKLGIFITCIVNSFPI